MKNKWSDENAKTFSEKFSDFGADLSELAYVSRLIGEEKDLALHGGGNTSIKSSIQIFLGIKFPPFTLRRPALIWRISGRMASSLWTANICGA